VEFIAERDHAADPQSFALGSGDFVPDALGGDFALELGKGQEDIEGQPAHRGRGVELLGDRHKRGAVGIEQFDHFGEVGKGARQPIDLVDNDDIDPSRPDVGEQLLKGGSVRRPSGKSTVVIAGPDQYPTGMSLAADIGLRCIILRIEGVELLVQAGVCRHARVNRASDRFVC